MPNVHLEAGIVISLISLLIIIRMLTDRQIKKLVADKKVTIAPYDENNVMAGKYNIHLGRYLLKPLNQGGVIDFDNIETQPKYEKLDLKEESFILEPGQFVLGQTNEEIGLSSDVGMFLDGSTSFARVGVTIHQSAFFIPPVQDPHIITLEFYNAGPWRVKLSYLLRVGKLIAFSYSEANKISAKMYNRYNGQKETTGSILMGNNEV